ncbi:MAG: SURF1 family protein [Alphaproteobacteria bacterium]
MSLTRLRSLAVPAIATLVALAILLSLGFWQLERLAWKNALVASVEQRTHATAIPLAPRLIWPSLTAERDEYRRVTASGRYRHDKESYLYWVAGDTRRAAEAGRLQGQGYMVFTPLALDGGGEILVNRGFVPLDRLRPESRAAGQVDGLVTVTGLIRFSEPRGLFAASDDAARRLFYTRDIAAMARSVGLATTDLAPFSLDQERVDIPGGIPQAGETRVTFTNRHFEYALTWFGLALTLVGVFLAFAWGRLRAPKE